MIFANIVRIEKPVLQQERNNVISKTLDGIAE